MKAQLCLLLCFAFFLPASWPVVAQSGNLRVTITSDNAYAFGFGDEKGIDPTTFHGAVLNIYTHDIFGNLIWDVQAHGGALPVPGEKPSYGPERYTLNDDIEGKYIYIAAWSDNAVWQGTIAAFEDVSRHLRYTTGPGSAWQVYATGRDKDSHALEAPTLEEINAGIAEANTKVGSAPGSIGWVHTTGCVDGSEGCRGVLLHCPEFTEELVAGFPDLRDAFGDAQFMWYRNPDFPLGDCYVSVRPADRSGEFLIFRLGPLNTILPVPCDSIGLRMESNPEDRCCVEFPLSNNLGDYWSAIRLRLLSDDAVFGNARVRDGWEMEISPGGKEALARILQGGIPVCRDETFFGLCLEGPEHIDARMEVEWISRESVHCVDTVAWSCDHRVDPCDDPQCTTDTLDIGTGVKVAPGGLEPHWVLTAVPDSVDNPVLPRAPYVIENDPAWYPYDGSTSSEWISPNPQARWDRDNPDQPYEFTYCFCVCRRDTLLLDMHYWVDNAAVVKLDGITVSALESGNNDAFQSGKAFRYSFLAEEASRHCLTIEVKNLSGIAMGLLVEGTVRSVVHGRNSLLRHECCDANDSLLTGQDPLLRMGPRDFRLLGCYPTPAKEQATIDYLLGRGTNVRIELFDLLGRHRATVLNTRCEAGAHSTTVDTKRLPSGTYVVRMSSDAAVALTLLRVAR